MSESIHDWAKQVAEAMAANIAAHNENRDEVDEEDFQRSRHAPTLDMPEQESAKDKKIKSLRSKYQKKALDKPKPPSVKEPFFATCDRDEGGHCKPKGEGGSSGGSQKTPQEIEKEVAKLKKQVVGTQAMTQARAKKGGEIGPNGEPYPGGAFIATTDMPKKIRAKIEKFGKGKKVVVNPGEWEVIQPGKMSILDKLGGTVFNHRDQSINYAYLEWRKSTPEEVAMYEELVDKWKQGVRWVDVVDYPALAGLEDAARMVVSGMAVPGDVLNKFSEEWRSHFTKYKPKGTVPPDTAVVPVPKVENKPSSKVAQGSKLKHEVIIEPNTDGWSGSRWHVGNKQFLSAKDAKAHVTALKNTAATAKKAADEKRTYVSEVHNDWRKNQDHRYQSMADSSRTQAEYLDKLAELAGRAKTTEQAQSVLDAVNKLGISGAEKGSPAAKDEMEMMSKLESEIG